jgi:hypothetical protein
LELRNADEALNELDFGFYYFSIEDERGWLMEGKTKCDGQDFPSTLLLFFFSFPSLFLGKSLPLIYMLPGCVID